MKDDEIQLIKWVESSNSFQKKALDTIAENKMLHAENKALTNEVDGYRKRVCQMCDGHGMVGNIFDSMDCPDCVALHNKVKADTIEFANRRIKGLTRGVDCFNCLDAIIAGLREDANNG